MNEKKPNIEAHPRMDIRDEAYLFSPIDRMHTELVTANSAPKNFLMLTLAALGGQAPVSILAQRFQSTTKHTDYRYKIDTVRLVIDFMENNLVPYGLVLEQQVTSGYDRVYSLTTSGKTYGVPAAAHAMMFESTEHISLFQTFGHNSSTSESGIRAPIVRADVIAILSTAGRPLRFTEISSRHEFRNTTSIWADVDALVRMDVLTREKSTQPYAQGELSADLQAIQTTCKSLMKQHEQLAPELVRKTMGLPDDPVTTTAIEKAMEFLIANGLLSSQDRSIYTLSDKGRLIYTKFLQPLADLCSDRKNQSIIRAIAMVQAKLSRYAVDAFSVYAPHASATKRESLKTIRPILICALRDHPIGISLRELGDITGHNPDSLEVFVKDLIADGRVRSIKVGRSSIFLLN